mmetsp:Transcript_12636/g.27786  ORF Transcript_12636/g.27786 Transcript_12636/m.27786 type:complete len:257 (+) Transcript_12636:388-1158(+)
MAHVKSSGRFGPQVFQVAMQVGCDNVDVSRAVMPKSMFVSGYEFRFEQLLQISKCRATKEWTIWDAAKQRNPPSFHHCFGHVVLCLVITVRDDLVDHHTGHPYIVMLTKNSVQFQLVKGAAKSAIRYKDHVGPNERSTLCIVQRHNRSDRTVPCTLQKDNVAIFGHMQHGILNPVELIGRRYFSIHKLFGVPLRNNNRRHVLVIQMVQMEMFLYQANVLVHANCCILALRMHRDVLLSDGFDESNLVKSLLQSTHE